MRGRREDLDRLVREEFAAAGDEEAREAVEESRRADEEEDAVLRAAREPRGW